MRRYQFTAHIDCYIFSHKLPVVTEAVKEEPSETAAKVRYGRQWGATPPLSRAANSDHHILFVADVKIQ